MNINDPITVIRGIGPRISARLKALGIEHVRDLLLHMPARYEDRSRLTPLANLTVADQWVLVRCRILECSEIKTRRRNFSVIKARLEDSSGDFQAVWFNQRWITRRFQEESEVFLYGAVRDTRSGLQLVNPEVEEIGDETDLQGFVPVYPPLGPLRGRRLRGVIDECRGALRFVNDPLPADLRDRLGIIGLCEALETIHHPPVEGGIEAIIPAKQRITFDEALSFFSGMMAYLALRRKNTSYRCLVDEDLRNTAREMLPFSLTQGQKSAVAEIAADLIGKTPMARLLQGDVGSGKTVVAAMAMLIVVKNGYQCALMAPTEILAEQHFRSLTRLFKATPEKIALLTASGSTRDKAEVYRGLEEGDINIVIGTHALIQSTLKFKALGLVVIDEQHRFGVMQRQNLVDKAVQPHVLVMTATPIPRSLALTVFGDLDVSLIPDKPPGRKPVTTVLRTSVDRERLYSFISEEVASGGRVFIIYPLIEASETIAARSLEEYANEVQQALPSAAVGVLHGRLSKTERDAVYGDFQSGRIAVLLATTVIEVGVDVPEASIIVIESADRFGLAQLHQLRGRVGRGERRSWCVLLVDKEVSSDTRQRLEILVDQTSGFTIAEEDFKLRGAGELTGTQQWGLSGFRFLNLAHDHEVLKRARMCAIDLEARGELEEVRRALAEFHPNDFTVATG